MSKCKRFKTMISKYVDGELLAGDRNHFENHLKECPDCSKVISRIKILKDKLIKLEQIQTSSDFDTVLRTRIRIESGIGRRRLHEIVWDWPTKIPVYGMSLALIVIAVVLVVGQINKPLQPEAYPNKIWLGGNPTENRESEMINESDTHIEVIYEIDRVPNQNSSTRGDSINNVRKDSLRYFNNSRMRQVNNRVY